MVCNLIHREFLNISENRVIVVFHNWHDRGSRARFPHLRPSVTSVSATRAPASDSCQLHDFRAGSVKFVFACISTRQLYGRGCPAVTDGLERFCPARIIPAAGAGTPAAVNIHVGPSA